MPVISMFYGIVVLMYFFDGRRHRRPHVHARFQGEEVVIAIPDGEVLEGSLPGPKLKLVVAWVEAPPGRPGRGSGTRVAG